MLRIAIPSKRTTLKLCKRLQSNMFTLRGLLQVSGVTKVALAKENIIKDRIKNIRLHLFTGSRHCKNPPFRGHYCNTSKSNEHLFSRSLSPSLQNFTVITGNVICSLDQSSFTGVPAQNNPCLSYSGSWCSSSVHPLSDTSCFSSSYFANSRVGPTAGTETMFSEQGFSTPLHMFLTAIQRHPCFCCQIQK